MIELTDHTYWVVLARPFPVDAEAAAKAMDRGALILLGSYIEALDAWAKRDAERRNEAGTGGESGQRGLFDAA